MEKEKCGTFNENFLKNSTKLSYTIFKCSSYSSIYTPDHILQDKPWDPNSRWSSGSSTPPQFLILKLEKVSIVESITFGKLEKAHVCNVRKFKIFAGLTEENMTELVESGLRNDCYPETFSLRHRVNGYVFPCRYVKIVPLQSWGPSFNFSIWYVEVHGIDDHEIVQPQISTFNNLKEREAIRVCLKHLRDHNYVDAFTALQTKTNVKLEHPKMTELHEMLVKNGNFAGAETFLEDCSQSHLFHKFIMEQDYKACWNQIVPDLELDLRDEPITVLKPRLRGGHQMCIDVDGEQIFVFGGWDGYQELADLWSFNIPSGKWTLISENTEAEGGPSARSCHRMVLHRERRQIFTLGRFVDSQHYPLRSDVKSDFYVYEIDENKWTLISDDTHSYGGPELIFDHQMCIDSKKKLIYVFGGRVLNGSTSVSENSSQVQNSRDRDEEFIRFPDPVSASALSLTLSANSECVYSGLYSYHIPTNTWNLLRSDISSESKTSDVIKSRVGHSMLFHKELRKLYIFAGQRSREYLSDFFSYDVDRDEIEIIMDGSKGVGTVDAPLAGSTQRATIDTDLNEIYVFSGSGKDKDKRDDSVTVQNRFWVYDIHRNSWSCVYKSGNGNALSETCAKIVEPCPRHAHQLVYDFHSKIHYLFGGRTKDSKFRLDDFWSLELLRPAKSDVVHECKLMLRKQRFEELVSEDSLKALHYLQTSLSELVNHSDPIQSKEFQKLSHLLFWNTSDEGLDAGKNDPTAREEATILKRSRIFDKLVGYFPREMTQPRVNLIDLLSF